MLEGLNWNAAAEFVGRNAAAAAVEVGVAVVAGSTGGVLCSGIAAAAAAATFAAARCRLLHRHHPAQTASQCLSLRSYFW